MLINNPNFDRTLKKGECSEPVYKQYKELFDAAIESGLITDLQKFPRSKILINDQLLEERFFYRWKMAE